MTTIKQNRQTITESEFHRQIAKFGLKCMSSRQEGEAMVTEYGKGELVPWLRQEITAPFGWDYAERTVKFFKLG